MGMFDYIRCEVPLPDGWNLENDAVGLQTKDFDCEMVTHVVSKDGRLLFDRGHNESVPKVERPYPDAEDGDFMSLCGCIRRVPKLVDENFHGLLHFGGLELVGRKPPDEQGYEAAIYKDHAYVAKFTDGQLVSLLTDAS